MTETEARTLLLSAGYKHLDPWIAEQPWRPMLGGWQVMPALQGWRYHLEVAGAGRLRITAIAPGGDPVVWVVPFRR